MRSADDGTAHAAAAISKPMKMHQRRRRQASKNAALSESWQWRKTSGGIMISVTVAMTER